MPVRWAHYFGPVILHMSDLASLLKRVAVETWLRRSDFEVMQMIAKCQTTLNRLKDLVIIGNTQELLQSWSLAERSSGVATYSSARAFVDASGISWQQFPFEGPLMFD